MQIPVNTQTPIRSCRVGRQRKLKKLYTTTVFEDHSNIVGT